MNSYDAIVLGAGIAGLSVARELAKAKQRVLVIEREERGGKTSRAAAGIVDPYTEASEETPLLKLGLKAFQFYPDFLEELGPTTRTEVEYEKTGLLYLAVLPEDEVFLKDRAEWQRRRGLPVKSLSEKEVKQMETVVSPKTRGGVYYPEIPQLNADRLMTCLFRATEKADVEIKTGVSEISVRVEAGRVQGVDISGSHVSTPVVVVATGCWPELGQTLGVRFTVKPVRGQILILRVPQTRMPKHMLHTIRWAYVLPWPRHRILVGSTLEFAGFDNRTTEEGLKDILDRASEILEDIRKFSIETTWAGLRPYVEGRTPVVGPTETRGLFIVSGYYRSGILIGPLVGKLMAEAILSGTFSPLLEPFFQNEVRSLQGGLR